MFVAVQQESYGKGKLLGNHTMQHMIRYYIILMFKGNPCKMQYMIQWTSVKMLVPCKKKKRYKGSFSLSGLDMVIKTKHICQGITSEQNISYCIIRLHKHKKQSFS